MAMKLANGKKLSGMIKSIELVIKFYNLSIAPETNVFNGDMGEIVGIIYAKESDDKIDELVIQFDSNEVTYKRNGWNKITLSYCCSIHKSQG